MTKHEQISKIVRVFVKSTCEEEHNFLALNPRRCWREHKILNNVKSELAQVDDFTWTRQPSREAPAMTAETHENSGIKGDVLKWKGRRVAYWKWAGSSESTVAVPGTPDDTRHVPGSVSDEDGNRRKWIERSPGRQTATRWIRNASVFGIVFAMFTVWDFPTAVVTVTVSRHKCPPNLFHLRKVPILILNANTKQNNTTNRVCLCCWFEYSNFWFKFVYVFNMEARSL